MMEEKSKIEPIRVINAVAPVRICDNGGWTDTWFAQYGAVFNIAVSPYAEVQVVVYPDEVKKERVWLNVEDFDDSYAINLDQEGWDRHPLLEATVRRMGVPAGYAIRVNLSSEAPSGASTGTSAAVTVALIGALDRLNQGKMGAHEVAITAHQVETELLGRQSGIQDQLCSAFGGINYIEMAEYPQAEVTSLKLAEPLWWELEQRLALIYLGRGHDSSQVHEKVIAKLEDAGPDCKELEDLRLAAEKSRGAILSEDFRALGRAMIENTEGQERLHPELVSQEARRVIEIAREHGALGWKVNGAGGEGGSLTVLCGPRTESKRAMLREIEVKSPFYKVIPMRLDRYGLRRWEGIG